MAVCAFFGHRDRPETVRSHLREVVAELIVSHGVDTFYVGNQGQFDAMVPEGIEAVHPRYAIDWRNRWMLDRADCVVTYITHPWGGAAKFGEKARRSGKTVIDLSHP